MFIHRDASRLSRLTGEVVRWLSQPVAPDVVGAMSTWNDATWQDIRLIVFVQGLSPYFHHTLPGTEVYNQLPVVFQEWLAHQYRMNAARVAVIHEELGAILCAANRAGICIMPLKGSLFSTCHYVDPALRPMGDIDLLIQPHDLAAITQVLNKLGYEVSVKYAQGGRRYANHYQFIHPKAAKIVSFTEEHPDNPRSVEVHTSLHRGLWGEFGAYDITSLMWQGSSSGRILGEQAQLPSSAALLTHVAIHACRHFLMGEGRAIQWVDLALLASDMATLDQTYINWVYPVLRLASRSLPRHFDLALLESLAEKADARLRRWAETVPLNANCGLILRFADHEQFMRTGWGRLQWHVNYWYPDRLRFALLAGDMPLTQAYRQYVVAYVRYLAALVRDVHRQYWHRS